MRTLQTQSPEKNEIAEATHSDSMPSFQPPEFALKASEGGEMEGEMAPQAENSGPIQEVEVSGVVEDGIPEEAWAIANQPEQIAALEQQDESETQQHSKDGGPIQGFFGKIWGGIKKGVKWVGNGIKNVGKSIARGAKKVWNGVKTGAIWAWGGVKTIAKAIGNYGWDVIKSGGALVYDFVRKAPGRIFEVIKHLGKGAFGVLKFVWDGIKTAVTNPKGLGKWFMDGILGGAAWTGRLIGKLLDVISIGEIFDFVSQIIKFNSRTLSGAEVSEAQKVFGNSISYWQVRIDQASLIAKIGAWFQKSTGMGVTTFHTINFNRKISTAPGNGDMSWLIHELTHVAQYEARGSQYLGEAIYAQATDGYNYGGPTGLAGKSFSDFNREQQGDIAEDYYEGVLFNNKSSGVPGPSDLATYQPLIDQLRAGQI